jgi:peptidoglycan/xylan/chitin deacetylase (PgdA/CDA1 family)
MGWAWQDPAVRFAARLLPGDVLWFVETSDPVFALTFDDGPHPDTTPGLLSVLARHRARATFFLIGSRVAEHPELAAAIAAGGHEIGNHLMHDEASVRLPEARFRADLAATNALLMPYGEVRWFRPGSGWFTPRMLRAAGESGLRAVLGTASAAHRGEPSDAQIAARIGATVRPGSIVVLHEGTERRRGVVETTDRMLPALAGRGLTAVTVSDLARRAAGR